MKYLQINLCIVVAIVCMALPTQAQKGVTTVGLQYKPIIPVQYFDSYDNEVLNENFSFRMRQRFGYAAGMIIRHNVTDKFSIESGINFVQRNFRLNISRTDSFFEAENIFRVIGYEIPLTALVYVRLDERVYMNVSFGGCLDFFPSDVLGETNRGWIHETVRYNWAQVSLLANVGWEYRTERSGVYYLGFSFHRPFTDAFMSKIGPFDARPVVNMNLNGNYITFDLRYFFHEDPAKAKERQAKRLKKKEKKQQKPR